MGTLMGRRFIPVLLGAAAASCSGGLTLPGDGTGPTGDESGPAAIQVYSGNPQEGRVGSRLPEPIVVKVLDAHSQPVAGVAVVFEFESAVPGAEVSPSQDVTTSDGLASAEVWLGNDAGAHVVEARVADASSDALRATFDLNALARGKDKDKDKGKGPGRDDDDDEDDDD